jgi:chorismate mutase/prephenate dehydratase
MSKKIIKKAKVGFLGPEGTFSWAATKTIFPKNNIIFKPFSVIKEVFEAVSRKEVDFGVVPIENSFEGLISETMHSFINNHPVYAAGSFKIPIHHCFVSRGKKLKDIKLIKSHPQAFSQCKRWLEKNLPLAVQEPTKSTISPIFEDFSESTGFIIPCFSVERFKLNVLARNIEDARENFTRFFLISSVLNKSLFQKLDLPVLLAGGSVSPTGKPGRSAVKPARPAGGPNQTTLLLISVYDRVGILRDILDVFAKRKINLTALHSIPSYLHPWDYLFYIELEKSYFAKDFKELKRELEQYCPFIRVLGIG